MPEKSAKKSPLTGRRPQSFSHISIPRKVDSPNNNIQYSRFTWTILNLTDPSPRVSRRSTCSCAIRV
ncbi:unnamed protein product [Allacma fusca]|uniref:Uncharacterized protein n=1 Tax=Allacma fusca TaxID=39272 RepID=A0A8J2LRW9_9HEXA|nr:unnamed protein product [Allacma fusca]